jgi:hypothetical protein
MGVIQFYDIVWGLCSAVKLPSMCFTGHVGRAYCLESARCGGGANEIRDTIIQIFCHGDNPITGDAGSQPG